MLKIGDNSTYPKIFIPIAIEKIIGSCPPVPELPIKPKKPIEPNKVDEKSRDEGCMSSTTALIILALGIIFIIWGADKRNGGQIIFGSLFFIGIGIFGLYLSSKTKTDFKDDLPKRKKKYREDIDIYHEELTQYEKELQNFNIKQQRFILFNF